MPETANRTALADPNAPLHHYHASSADPWILLTLGLLFAAGVLLVVWMRRRTRRAYAPLDTRERLDAYDHRARGAETILVPTAAFGLPVLFALWWWGAWINDHVADATYAIHGFLLWYKYLATPTEQNVVLILGTTLLLLLALAAFVVYYIAFRSLFPDLYRLDPDGSPGGRPEPIGRIYKQRAFRDPVLAQRELADEVAALVAKGWTKDDLDEAMPDLRAKHARPNRLRLYYHHDWRVLPPVCDIIDVPLNTKFRYGGLGKRIALTPPWQRAPELGRRVRVLARRSVGSQPISTSWRQHDFRRDQRRKVSLVMTGASQNPDATQRKFEREATMTQFQDDALEGVLSAEMQAFLAQQVHAEQPRPAQPEADGQGGAS